MFSGTFLERCFCFLTRVFVLNREMKLIKEPRTVRSCLAVLVSHIHKENVVGHRRELIGILHPSPPPFFFTLTHTPFPHSPVPLWPSSGSVQAWCAAEKLDLPSGFQL